MGKMKTFVVVFGGETAQNYNKNSYPVLTFIYIPILSYWVENVKKGAEN
jgi:hypothetical protein